MNPENYKSMEFYCVSQKYDEKDLLSVEDIACFAFGPVISENALIKGNLRGIVDHLVSLAHSKIPFTIKSVHSVLDLFGVKTKGLKKYDEMRMFIEAAFFHICYLNNIHEEGQFPDVNTFVEHYGVDFFDGLNGHEIELLLKYRNYMAIAVKYIHPKNNRDYLLSLITKLSEGFTVEHVPGSGATRATRSRIDIYRKEGNVTLSARAPRRVPDSLPVLESVAPASLRRGRSLDEGGEPPSKKRCLEMDTWVSIADDPAIAELFDNFESPDKGLEVDELDILLNDFNWPELKLSPACNNISKPECKNYAVSAVFI